MISIIMPIYNRANVVLETIKSVLRQSYSDIELIIVDDGSTDNLEEVIDSVGDSRIVLLKNEKNIGSNPSRNVGIKNARGDYISFIDSTDVWEEKKLEREYEELIGNGADLVFCAESFQDEKTCRKIPSEEDCIAIKKGCLNQILQMYNVVDTTTIFVKSDIFDIIGMFDEEIPRLQDYELMIRAVQCLKVSFLDEVLVYSHISADSITKNNDKLIEAVIKIYNKHKYFFDTDEKKIEFLMIPLNVPIKGHIWEWYDIYKYEIEKSISDEYVIHLFKDTLIKNYMKSNSVNNVLARTHLGIHTVVELINREEKLGVFGDGVWARKILKYLNQEGLQRKLSFFVVGNNKNNTTFEGYPLLTVDELNNEEKRMMMVIAVSYKRCYEAAELLLSKDVNNLFILDRNDKEVLM